MERSTMRNTLLAALAALACAAIPSWSAAPKAAPAQDGAENPPSYQFLIDAANAAVTVKAKAIANARSIKTLGDERTGAGVLIAPEGLVLTIGYLILEADEVEITTARGRTIPATVVAYDHATGFGLLRPMAPLDVKPVRLGSSASVESLDRLMTVGGGGEESVTVATVVSRRRFAGYWEYMIDDAIFTAPPRYEHSGAGLLDDAGRLVGIASLWVSDGLEVGAADHDGNAAHASAASAASAARRVLRIVLRSMEASFAPRWSGTMLPFFALFPPRPFGRFE